MNSIPAVSVTVLPKEDETMLRGYIDNPGSSNWVLVSNRQVIFRAYQSPIDLPATIDLAALKMTTRIIVETVKLFDKLSIGE
ncbi:MAG: hypothetical protein COB93_10185 [Sneathiella sp.]|nr:MAG: hypothetical protein COB93_10185 [Sneathiella sp.]